jgi:hypothetical protein
MDDQVLPLNISAFLDTFSRWAHSRPDIHAVALVGSYARDAATENSDVDLLILTTNVDEHIRDRSWVSLFGKIVESRVEDWGKVKSLRCFYEGGLEVEYGLTTPDWADVPLDVGSQRVVSDGMRVLYDPLDTLNGLQSPLGGSKPPLF